MDVDIDNIIFKIYQYFHIYTVRTEQLKEYCDLVDIEYRKLLSHSKTRWLSLFPGITRLANSDVSSLEVILFVTRQTTHYH